MTLQKSFNAGQGDLKTPAITVFWFGGGRAATPEQHDSKKKLDGVDFVVANTGRGKRCSKPRRENRVQLAKITKVGCWRTGVGRLLAVRKESIDRLLESPGRRTHVLYHAGNGRGTRGQRAAPIIAQAATEAGCPDRGV